MSEEYFSLDDLKQIYDEGLTPEEVSAQLDQFRMGMKKIRLSRPCLVNDGIVRVDGAEIAPLAALHDEAARQGRFMKFVPASGAASRMFELWYRALETGELDAGEAGREFARQLKLYAFYDDLERAAKRKGILPEGEILAGRLARIIDLVLADDGLGYGRLPKAMIKFHKYPGGARTPLEEHLVEGAGYLTDENGHCRLHFTLGKENLEEIEKFIDRIKVIYEQELGVLLDITISDQRRSTNTIAADQFNRPFRDSQGKLVFRPGGHGSLLENLEGLDGDIIFIKNIDNVAPERLLPLVILYKKVLGGIFLKTEGEVFQLLAMLEEREGKEANLALVAKYLKEVLQISFPDAYERMTRQEQVAFLGRRLARPLRVCAVVRNEGEPGGGPFFVIDEAGEESIQIVEEFQVEKGDPKQLNRWSQATHFNPVDMVCGMRNREGKHYCLSDHVDNAYFGISKKSKDGRDLLALERPGLWNGSMGLWNSILVEVPLSTFNPVKTVEDLLRPQHQA
ncbi:MAG: DUF4301 family protein [Smithellaceae bacterium]|nr:DUF4301 family protein [Smithellaceae bacterium]